MFLDSKENKQEPPGSNDYLEHVSDCECCGQRWCCLCNDHWAQCCCPGPDLTI